jgi:PrtD family type I secretion system ABC transporter
MREFLVSCQFYFKYAFFFSMFVNILQLTFPIYMLQVYDKVLTSYNFSTLTVITVAAVICLVVLALLEWLRSRLLVRAGIEFDRVLSMPVLRENLKNATSPVRGVKQGTLRDVQTLRTFLAGNAVFAFFDFPWTPLYFLLIFIMHPALGMVAVLGGIAVFLLGILTERLTRGKLDSATMLNGHSAEFLAASLRNASIVRSMGMIGNVAARWEEINRVVIDLQTKASHSAGLLHSISKALRIGLQVLIYAVGAYLALLHVATAGAMIAASIIMGRALAPIDQAMATYKQSLEARGAYKRLRAMLDVPPAPPAMELPDPVGDITLENVFFTVGDTSIIKGMSLYVPSGQSIAVIGPSAAGKSTLCKLMLGIWTPSLGKARIDGADIASWDAERLGPFLGYLPQDVELFSGSIAENIARMGDVDSKKVIFASRLSGVHNLVLRLPKGYDTQIGEHGDMLSGGQRQRIGLARALYGNPRVVVLDEPNSNLDEEGEACLLQAVLNLKQLKSTVVLVTHKPSVLSVVDNILVMRDGQVAMCGPRQEILAKLTIPRQQQQEQTRPRQETLRQQRLAKESSADA